MSVRWMTSKGVVAYHVAFAFLPGSNSTIALFLSQVAYWCQKADGGMAWLTHDRLREQTGLTREQQDQAAKRLAEMGVLEKKLVGIPAKIHYKIDFDQLEKLMLEAAEGTLNQGCGKPTTKDAGFPQAGLRESHNHTNKEIQDKTLEETLSPQPPRGGAPVGADRKGKAQELVDLWNENAKESGTFPRARMTPAREGIFATRLKDKQWADDFVTALDWITNAPAAAHYRGDNDRQWVADLDFMLQNGKATSLAEKATATPQAPPEPATPATPQTEVPKWKKDRIAMRQLELENAKREITKLVAQGFSRATCPFRFEEAERGVRKAQEALDAELGGPGAENAATGLES